MNAPYATAALLREPSTAQTLAEAHPDRERRPRELLLAKGRESMRDEELLAIILRSGTRKCNVLQLATMLLRHYGTLRALGAATVEELVALKLPGLGTVKAIEIASVLELARRIAEEAETGDAPLTAPSRIAQAVIPCLLDAHQEYLFAFPLDKRFRLIGKRPVLVSQGLADATLIHPREVYRACVRLSAVFVIVAHNHPSGDPTPSADDVRSTRQLIEAGKVVGVPLLDHIVVGTGASAPFLSFRDRNVLSFDDAPKPPPPS